MAEIDRPSPASHEDVIKADLQLVWLFADLSIRNVCNEKAASGCRRGFYFTKVFKQLSIWSPAFVSLAGQRIPVGMAALCGNNIQSLAERDAGAAGEPLGNSAKRFEFNAISHDPFLHMYGSDEVPTANQSAHVGNGHDGKL